MSKKINILGILLLSRQYFNVNIFSYVLTIPLNLYSFSSVFLTNLIAYQIKKTDNHQ